MIFDRVAGPLLYANSRQHAPPNSGIPQICSGHSASRCSGHALRVPSAKRTRQRPSLHWIHPQPSRTPSQPQRRPEPLDNSRATMATCQLIRVRRRDQSSRLRTLPEERFRQDVRQTTFGLSQIRCGKSRQHSAPRESLLRSQSLRHPSPERSKGCPAKLQLGREADCRQVDNRESSCRGCVVGHRPVVGRQDRMPRPAQRGAKKSSGRWSDQTSEESGRACPPAIQSLS